MELSVYIYGDNVRITVLQDERHMYGEHIKRKSVKVSNNKMWKTRESTLSVKLSLNP